MNFRAGHARETSQALTSITFDSFDRDQEPLRVYFFTLMDYHQDSNYEIAFPSIDIKNCPGVHLSVLGMKQLLLAESEKYAHVTFFLNGG
jgi:2,3-bisphosphoglycerate-independent phosphoglycerate mutase